MSTTRTPGPLTTATAADGARRRRLVLAALLVAVITVAATAVGGVPGAGADGNEAPGAPAAFRSVTAGDDHTCALLDDGSVACWGFGQWGRLGTGDTADRGDGSGEMGDALPAVDLGTGRTATAITAGGSHTCALLDDGSVKCWGNGQWGRLGTGDTADRGDGPGEMGDALPAVPLGTDGLGNDLTATAITAGDAHTCALLDTGEVKCWGDGTEGRLGYGDTADRGDNAGEMGDALPAVDLGTGRTALAVSAGEFHTCALLDNGQLKCWGDGAFGALGQGDLGDRGDGPGEMGDALPAVPLGTGRTATAVTAGDFHTCVVLDNGQLKCWGLGTFGRLGYGDTFSRGDNAGEMGDALPAVDLGTGRTALAATTGFRHTCALLDDGSVRCWGDGAMGQLGSGDQTARGGGPDQMGDDLPAVDLGTGRTALAVSAGRVHTCALLDTGRLACWGEGDLGRLGTGATDDIGDGPGEMGDDLDPVDLSRLVGVGALARPDGHLRRGTSGPGFIGLNRYNTTGANQTRSASVARRGTARFTVRIENDGTYTDTFRVRAKGNTTRYTVTYRRGTNNITTAVRSGAGYLTPEIRPGQRLDLTVTIQAKATARRGDRIDRLVTITSQNDTTRKDAVKARVTRS